MAYNPNYKPVLLTKEQIEAVKQLQEEERRRSPLNVAPTVNAIVRGLVNKALASAV